MLLQGLSTRHVGPCSPRQRHKRFSARHPDYTSIKQDPLQPAVVQERPNLEADVRYRRVDYSLQLADEARHGFASCLAAGEAQLHLAKAALLVAAEDDAIASSSTVRFPVEAYLKRLHRLAADAAAALVAAFTEHQQSQWQQQQNAQHQAANSLTHLQPQQVVAAIEYVLFKQPRSLQQQQQHDQQQQQQWYSSAPSKGFSAPAYGRSNIPVRTLVDHPGVWEDARVAYLNEVLVRKRGHPAALMIIYCEVMQQLLLKGAIDFAVTFDHGDFSMMPAGVPLPQMTRSQLVLQDPQQQTSDPYQRPVLLNTCSSESLAELLRHLKRSYWPFPWDTNIDAPAQGGKGSLGGFRAAAKAALGSEDVSAALKAVSAVAAHRLSRGIWTSPGGGDLARCVAASERLVMMVGDEQPQERRDLAVLLLHSGRPAAAAAELSAYLDAARSGGRLRVNPFDLRLAEQLWKLVGQGSGVKPEREVMSVDKVLRGRAGSEPYLDSNEEQQHLPLTW